MRNFYALKSLSNLLSAHDIHHALGGSGLLAHLGMDIEINDWDLTTTASIDDVNLALASYQKDKKAPIGLFCSDYLLNVRLESIDVDVIGRFALRSGNDVISIDTIIVDYWDTVPVCCPRQWLNAYQILGDHRKVEFLTQYLASKA